jgi:hypothetical protein
MNEKVKTVKGAYHYTRYQIIAVGRIELFSLSAVLSPPLYKD